MEKVELDFSEVIGFFLSVFKGFMDFSLWERYYLVGINELFFIEFDYWFLLDKEVNRRVIFLFGVGFLLFCLKFWKLFVYGIVYEYFFNMIIGC